MLFCPLPTLQRVVDSIQKEGGLCEITNINSPVQTVVSGDNASLKECPPDCDMKEGELL